MSFKFWAKGWGVIDDEREDWNIAVMRWYVQLEVNQEESKQDDVDWMKEEVVTCLAD